ncbi:MAG: DUF2332 domain-containing protein [Sciscionella sp.]
MAESSLASARERLRRFAEQETAGASPLYEHLAAEAAADDEVAGLLTAAAPEFATPTLLLAAAHRLVLAEPISDLANYYSSVGGDYGVDGATWLIFRGFVMARAEKMRALIGSRSTQTNEVRRAALLYPAVALAAREAGGPVGLLEAGCSAGLLLGMDGYGYRYRVDDDEPLVAGPSKTPLVLDCALRLAGGAKPPKLPKKLAIGARVGLDRAPVDLTDEEAYAWLEACIWADHPERLRRLSLAAALQRKQRPEFVTGDVVDALALAARRIPSELPIVVITSYALPYLKPERRVDFIAALGALAADRPLWWVSLEPYREGLVGLLPDRADLAGAADRSLLTLGLVRWQEGTASARALANAASHGERMEWLP